MGLIFSKVLQMSMAAILLIVAVALLRIPLKKAPKWFMGVLWTIVALRLLVPIQIESDLGFMPDFGGVIQSAALKEPAKAAAYQTSEDSLTYVYESKEDVLSSEQVDNKGDGVSAKKSTFGYLTALWLVGIVLAIGYASYSYISIWRKTRVSIRYRSSDKVYVCDDIDTPFIFGLVKPVIYLPSGLDHDTIVNVIAHEKAHLKRKDHLRKGLGFFILTIHWFNPFVWLSYILFCRDIELACDERVISTMSLDEKKSYAESLLSCSTKKRRMMVYPVAFGEVAVGTRIRQIFNYKKPTFYLVLMLVMITMALATCSFTKAADKIIVTTSTGGYNPDGNERSTEKVDVVVEPVKARTRIEDIRWKEEEEEVKTGVEAKAQTQVQVEVQTQPQVQVKVQAQEQTQEQTQKQTQEQIQEQGHVDESAKSSTSDNTAQVKSEDTNNEILVDVTEENTHVSVSVDDVNIVTSVEPVQEAVNVTEEIVDEVTDGVLIEGGIADTAVDTAFGITTDTLGLVDSILGW